MKKIAFGLLAVLLLGCAEVNSNAADCDFVGPLEQGNTYASDC